MRQAEVVAKLLVIFLLVKAVIHALLVGANPAMAVWLVVLAWMIVRVDPGRE